MKKDAGQTMRIDLAERDLPTDSSHLVPSPYKKADSKVDFSTRRHQLLKDATPYDLLLESVYDGVLIADRRGRVIEFNGRAGELLCATEAQLRGVHVWELLSGADKTLIPTLYNNLRTHKFALIEALCLRGDGTSFPTEIAVNRLVLEGSGELLCFFVRDTTVRKRAQAALEDAVERLQAHDRARMEFISNVSHELRTPLTSMIYAVNNMLRGVVGPLPEKATQYLERFDSDCKRLLATVNDILDLRQIETETLTLTKSRVTCSTLVQVGVETLRVQAEARQLRIVTELPPYDLFCYCDAHKIMRVMINVLGNAVKFTQEKNGIITVRVERDLINENMVLFTVVDTGIGIPSEALERITQRYFRIGSHTSGTGLGLAISREIVELHGGTLQVTSPAPKSDHGTMVAIRLPLDTPPTVAICTSTTKTAELLTRQLKKFGYAPKLASSPKEALELCFSRNADMLIFEVDCSCEPDFEMLLRLRNDSRTQHLPALVVSQSEISKPCREMLSHLGVPRLPVPWQESTLGERLSSAFSGRSLVSMN